MTHTDRATATSSGRDPLRRYRLLARAQGTLNVLGGAWPLLHLRGFEAVFGPKEDTWLVHTVAGLLVANGWAQLRAASADAGLARARDLGLGTALTLLAVDVVYVSRGCLRWTYLLDAAVEAAWVVGWSAAPDRGVRVGPRSGLAGSAGDQLLYPDLGADHRFP